MRIEKMIYDVIKPKLKEAEYDEEDIFNGIAEYAADNHISLLVEKMEAGGKNPAAAIEMFLKPITNLSTEAVVSYFTQYHVLKEFRRVSNQIFETARHFYATKEMKSDIVALEANLNTLAAKLYYDASLKNMIDAEVSENVLDIDYMNGKSDNMSLRLGREVKHFAE